MPTASATALHSASTAGYQLPSRAKVRSASGSAPGSANQTARSQPPRAPKTAPLAFSFS